MHPESEQFKDEDFGVGSVLITSANATHSYVIVYAKTWYAGDKYWFGSGITNVINPEKVMHSLNEGRLSILRHVKPETTNTEFQKNYRSQGETVMSVNSETMQEDDARDNDTEPENGTEPVKTPIVLRVIHTDNVISYHETTSSVGWRIDAAMQTLVVGRGLDRTIIPLCNVRYILFGSTRS